MAFIVLLFTDSTNFSDQLTKETVTQKYSVSVSDRDTLYFCVTVSFVSWSRTPLDDAEKFGHTKIIEYLKSIGVKNGI